MAQNKMQEFEKYGIRVAGAKGFMATSGKNEKANAGSRYILDYAQIRKQLAMDSRRSGRLAMDSATVTAPSIGFPVQLFNRIDPNVIDILFSALNATQLLPLRKEGDWTTDFATFITQEDVGSVSGYSDFGNATTSDVNFTFPSRQSFRYQTSIQYGELEAAKSEVATVNLVAAKQRAAANIMARNENKFYLFGVAGIKNYGLLNDPNLNTPISPVSQPINGGGGQTTWAEKAKDGSNASNYFFRDVVELFKELSENNGGLIDSNSELVLALSNKTIPYLSYASTYNVSVTEMISKAYPNLRIVTLPELSSSDEKMIMIAPSVMGQATGYCVYCEKFNAGPVIPDVSSFRQKVKASTMGAVITQPSAIAIMSGL